MRQVESNLSSSGGVLAPFSESGSDKMCVVLVVCCGEECRTHDQGEDVDQSRSGVDWQARGAD